MNIRMAWLVLMALMQMTIIINHGDFQQLKSYWKYGYSFSNFTLYLWICKIAACYKVCLNVQTTVRGEVARSCISFLRGFVFFDIFKLSLSFFCICICIFIGRGVARSCISLPRGFVFKISSDSEFHCICILKVFQTEVIFVTRITGSASLKLFSPVSKGIFRVIYEIWF